MSSNSEKARKAIDAMKLLGFSKKQSTPVLKRLLKLFDNNWEPIEDECYRALADAILDAQDNNPNPATCIHGTNEEPESRGITRLRPDHEHPSSSRHDIAADDDYNETPLFKRPCRIKDKLLELEPPQTTFATQASGPASPQPTCRQTRAMATAQQAAAEGEPSAIVAYKGDTRSVLENPQDVLFFKEPKPEPEIDEFTCPDGPGPVAKQINIGSSGGKNMLVERCKTRKMVASGANASIGIVNQNQSLDSSPNAVALCKNDVQSEVKNNVEASFVELDVASSTMGEVKMSLKCNLDSSKFNISLDEVFKMVEDKCLHSYKILPPGFSIGKLMNEVCQHVVQLGTVHSEVHSDGGNTEKEALNTNAPFVKPIACEPAVDGNGDAASIVAWQPDLALSKKKPVHDAADISKGQEHVRISIVNEVGRESCPPSFYYIQRNIVFQNAYVNISIARIGDEDCCADCSGDCLSKQLPCACARVTGGEFAYTPEGLVRTAFLDECISINHFPEKHHKSYCEDCPLERSKNQASRDPCKGHIARKFIKECWNKCGCDMQCGNRLIQRGITCNLQVFFTSEGKGWGLRTIDELPKGAFVCEYVGEVLTSMELYERTTQNSRNAKHVHQVPLDADWGSEGVLKDEGLFLDATFYGNVGRFVNHRCYDANLILIPVEVETPDHRYYHPGFFTTKKVEAFEELTWDYGIDFDGFDCPNKAFRCMCGSRYCRDPKNSRRSGRAAARRNEEGNWYKEEEGDVGGRHRPLVPARKLLILELGQQQQPVRHPHLCLLWLRLRLWLSFRRVGHGRVRVRVRVLVGLRAESSSDVVQLRVRRRAGHVGAGAAVGPAAAVAGDDGQRERGEGGVRAAGGAGAQHHRAEALQPAQGEGHRAALPGDHRVLQDHRRRREAEARPHPPGQEERREARLPRLINPHMLPELQTSIHIKMSLRPSIVFRQAGPAGCFLPS